MDKRETPRIDLKRNLYLYYAAIGVIALGYLLLAIGGADSFTSRTLGPVVIVIGFLIAVPIALLYRDSRSGGPSEPAKPSSKIPTTRT